MRATMPTMYCQSCGAKNANDAKFCNQCGASIAQPGDAAGPVNPSSGGARVAPGGTVVGTGSPTADDARPIPATGGSQKGAGVNVWEQSDDDGYGGDSMLSVSLAAIGVRSSKKVWFGFLLAALALVGLGAAGSYFLREDPEPIADAGHASPDDPFVIGTPLPEGEAPPGVDFVSGQVRGSEMNEGSPEAAEEEASSTMRTRRPRRRTSPSAGGTAPSPTMETTRPVNGASEGTGSEGTGSEGAGNTAPTAGTNGGTDTSGGGTAAGEAPAEGGSENETAENSNEGGEPTEGGDAGGRDLQMDLYASNVRFFIRRYYAARAQSCFDRATRNQPTLSGTVVIAMTVGTDGNVSSSRVARNTTGDDNLGTCLRNQVSQWRLPAPPGGSLEMSMPFSR